MRISSVRSFGSRLCLGLGLFISLQSAAAADTCGQLIPKDPLAFVPFQAVNPETGRAYQVGDMLEIPAPNGTLDRLPALDYFAKLNTLEERLTALGYSVRNRDLAADDFFACYQDINADDINFDELDEDWLDDFGLHQEFTTYGDVELPSPGEMPEPDLIYEKLPLKAKLIKDWAFEFGNPEKLATGLYPYVHVYANDIEARVQAGARWTGAVLGKIDTEIAHVQAVGQSPGTGPLKASIDVYVLGGLRVWGKPIASMKPLEFSDRYVQDIGQHMDHRFVIGPIPAKARIGYRGEAGVKWKINLVPLQAGAHTIPWAGADVYAQVGGDLGLAGVGVNGRLILLRDSLVVNGNTTFASEEGKPEIKIAANVGNKLNALRGELNAFMYVYKPTTEPPFLEKFEMEFPLFEYPGIERDDEIFNFTTNLTN